MYRLALVPLILILSACSTPPAEPVRIRLSADLVKPCDPLPMLTVESGADLRPKILSNRVESDRVHSECMAKHKAVIQAVNPRTPREPRSTK